ncbi:MAG: BNR-4 repeat-containing protein, partial [Bacteroidota bacterium]
GYQQESDWARGQGWGMYGYHFMYQHTGKAEYLELSERTARHFISHLPKDIIPYWDFDAPKIPNEPKDASAASIAASTLLSLYTTTEKIQYYNVAVRILNELSSDRYLNRNMEFGGLIEHSVGAKPLNQEVDVHINYADYYYLEALLKLQKIENKKKAQTITLNQSSKHHQGIWYGIGKTKNEYAYKYSGGLGSYPVKHRPFLVYSEEAQKTFFTYGASKGDDHTALHHAVGYFDHTTKQLSEANILLNKATDDAHDNPVIALDSMGYIWIFSTSHGRERPSYIHKSKQPYDITTFELVNATTAWNTIKKPFDNFSYAQVWNNKGGGFIMFSTRYAFPTNRNIGFQTSHTGQHWSQFQTIANMGEGHYQISGSHEEKHFTVFNYHPKSNPVGEGIHHRTNLYYLETKDHGKTWQTVNGRIVDLPLVDVANDALVKDYEALGRNVYLKDVRTDASGQPVILFLTSKGGYPGPEYAPYEWHTAHWNGKHWQINRAFESDHNYDMGSLY